MVSITQSALFIAFFLVLAASLFITSLFRIKAIVPYLLSIYLFSFGNILLTGELAGLFSLLNNRIFFLLVHVLILAITIVVWKITGTPPLFAPIIRIYKSIRSTDFKTVVNNHPILCVFGLGVTATFVLTMIINLEIPPNNYDSMTCHMARIGYWLQHGNFLPWSTWFTSQVDYPINAQIQILWGILFWRTDKFAAFPQWFAMLFSLVAIYGIARLMKKTQAQSLFACFIFALFPQILLQSVTTMPHLMGAALGIIAYYFLLLAFQERNKLFFVLSGLAIGMAISVHLIVIIMLPGFALTILYLMIKNRKSHLKPFQWMLGSCLISFLLFSSYMYIQNTVLWHQPLGRGAASNPWSLQTSVGSEKQNSFWSPQNFAKYTFHNIAKYIFISYDFSGLPTKVSKPFYDLREMIAVPLFEKAGIPLKLAEFDVKQRLIASNENWAWFGFVGFILFFPIMIIQSITAIKKRDSIRIVLIGSILVYSLLWSSILSRIDGWTIYSGRYFVPAAMFLAPLIAGIYKKGVGSKILCAFLVIASLYIGYETLLNDYAKPLWNKAEVFAWNRNEKIYEVSRDQEPMIRSIDYVLPRGTLGLALSPSLMEYPFFGEYFKRTLIPIYPYDMMQNTQWLKEQQIDWILTCVDFTGKPEGFDEIEIITVEPPIGITSKCIIYKRQGVE